MAGPKTNWRPKGLPSRGLSPDCNPIAVLPSPVGAYIGACKHADISATKSHAKWRMNCVMRIRNPVPFAMPCRTARFKRPEKSASALKCEFPPGTPAAGRRPNGTGSPSFSTGFILTAPRTGLEADELLQLRGWLTSAVQDASTLVEVIARPIPSWTAVAKRSGDIAFACTERLE